MLFFALLTLSTSQAEQYELDFDTAALKRSIDSLESVNASYNYQFRPKSLIAPSVVFAIGTLPLYVNSIDEWDVDMTYKIGYGNEVLRFDDYLQYSPVFIMWGLDAFGGIQPSHKFKQQTTILLTATIFSAAIVRGAKLFVDRPRPDTGVSNSYPSGHAATTFLCADMLHQEYGHHSPWISVAGYTLATVSSFMRVYNDRHYVGDCVVGAGIGVLSSRFAYWVAPTINRWLWGSATGYDNNSCSASLTACAIGDSVGLGLSLSF